MWAGNVEKAAALAVKIGDAIKDYNTADLSRVNVLSDTKNMWAKVRQLTGRSKSTTDMSQNSAFHRRSLEQTLYGHCDRRQLHSTKSQVNGQYSVCL
jgi:hypothetical protein